MRSEVADRADWWALVVGAGVGCAAMQAESAALVSRG